MSRKARTMELVVFLSSSSLSLSLSSPLSFSLCFFFLSLSLLAFNFLVAAALSGVRDVAGVPERRNKKKEGEKRTERGSEETNRKRRAKERYFQSLKALRSSQGLSSPKSSSF